MVSIELRTAYEVLGLDTAASRAQVKEAFLKLCQQHHPDKVPAAQRLGAEARFKELKAAYDTILRGQAGYNVPPPGSAPNAKYARAYYRAHGMGMDFGEGGPVRCGGPFGGYATETDFYRAMFRTTRNNPFVLIVTGLLAIPAISLMVSVTSGDTEWIRRFRDQGLHVFGHDALRANGRAAVGINPFAIRRLEDMHESYIFKNEKYAHLRKGMSASVGGQDAGQDSSDTPPATS
ncbi:hypothetical protein HYH02_006650 [Chlamydomonas schloesseri]|uniref:J domain-containing protein n=1 Tax=Chlamydomonas schloesseri TaxID=2026947 RepID=A0A835SW94_9CHLO|nr:hypothetical protein HYH02_006650 [Chlamydomonas schloesseri]|eukprot:KAG2432662.1 hypothetical protein HYH02_006650 [Chlamydomonas schloesseri]